MDCEECKKKIITETAREIVQMLLRTGLVSENGLIVTDIRSQFYPDTESSPVPKKEPGRTIIN